RGVEAKVRADASANALPKGIAGHKGRLGFVTAARNKARINGHSISQMPVEKARGGSNPVHLTTVLPGPARSLLAGPFSDHAHRRIVQRGGALAFCGISRFATIGGGLAADRGELGRCAHRHRSSPRPATRESKP